ncbi:hypothetical protein GCM10007416_35460 [Kroppenstedtia guangzhouensis]|uniref:Uncharacterized protein n=1 Tax=Kroppenstedtia guangzhouensis TaxID=1274356 RepID=A0ABQ1H592_9BACL|nr:hypothetical protein GCM10007416_35460 [Kroppenstedtia guangzhouensis]
MSISYLLIEALWVLELTNLPSVRLFIYMGGVIDLKMTGHPMHGSHVTLEKKVQILLKRSTIIQIVSVLQLFGIMTMPWESLV